MFRVCTAHLKMKIIYVWRALQPLPRPSSGQRAEGHTDVYRWHQHRHYRNASALASLLHSAFSPDCKLVCCLRSAVLSGLQFCRSQYCDTVLENSPFLILYLLGFACEVGEHGTGLRRPIRTVSLWKSVCMRECAYVFVWVGHLFHWLLRAWYNIGQDPRVSPCVLHMKGSCSTAADPAHIPDLLLGSFVTVISWQGWKDRP